MKGYCCMVYINQLVTLNDVFVPSLVMFLALMDMVMMDVVVVSTRGMFLGNLLS